MKVAAFGSVGDVQEQAQQQSAQNGQELLRIAIYTALQAVFIAPGLWVVGVRGWRLLGGSLAGSASFTFLSWLWAYAHGAHMLPVGLPNELGKAIPRRRKATVQSSPAALGTPEVIDLRGG